MRELHPEKMTKTERLNWMYSVDALKMVEFDLHEVLFGWNAVPRDWHYIWEDRDRRDPARTKITVRFDADVVKFFRSMGEGYQHRMNRVLRGYMHARLAKLIEGPDTTDYVLNPERVLEHGAKPAWGETEKFWEEDAIKPDASNAPEL